MSNSVSLHRVIKATPEKVFKAFSDPVAQAFWLPLTDFSAPCRRWISGQKGSST